MKYLLDTCVISELIKKTPNADVVHWINNEDENNLYLSVLTIGEITKGIEKLQNSSKKTKLKFWLNTDLKQRFKNRMIEIDSKTSIAWGEIQANNELLGHHMPAIDSLIVAQAMVNNCVVVTRNIKDMQQNKVELFNPWQQKSLY